jgi:hypothetical protein
MKTLAVVLASMLAGLAACSPKPAPTPQPASAPAPEQHYEAVTITGTHTVEDNVIKLNESTGAAWIHCCGSNNTNFTSIKDGAMLPVGDYHLLYWSVIRGDGGVDWNVYRIDHKTGHMWVVVVPSTGNYYWSDVNSTVQ